MSIETTLTQTPDTALTSLVSDCGNFEQQKLKAGKGNSPLVELALTHYAQPGILQLLETSQAIYREAALRWLQAREREAEGQRLWFDVEETTAEYDHEDQHRHPNPDAITETFEAYQKAYEAYSAFMRKDPAD